MDDTQKAASEETPKFAFAVSLGLGAAMAGACIAVIVHTTLAVAALYTPVPWGDINAEHVWISQHGVRAADLFRPHNEHIILLPRLFFLVDFYAFGASSIFLHVAIFVLALGIVGMFWFVASRWFFTRRFDAAMYACLLAAGYVNGLHMFNLVCGLMIQHWLANFLFLILALLFAQQCVPCGARNGWSYAVAMVPLGFVAVFSSGNGVMSLATAAFLAAVFGLGWKKTAFYVGLLGLLTVAYLKCNASAGSAQFSVFWESPYNAAKCYFAFLGGPGSRFHSWPANAPFWEFSPQLTMIRGIVVFVLGITLCLCEWLQPRRRTVFSMFNVFVIVLVFATGIGTVAARMPMGVFEGVNTKYACTVMLAWMAILSLILKQLAPLASPNGLRRSMDWAAALALVIAWMLPAHFREIRVWQDWTDHLWESEAAVVVGAYDEPLIKTLSWGNPKAVFDVLQKDFRQRRWGPFARYDFEPGDMLAEKFSVDASYPGLGQVTSTTATTSGPKTLATVTVQGWCWDQRRQRAFHDILLADDQGRIVGIAHTTRLRPDIAERYGDPARRQSGWFGFARASLPAKISAYGVIGGTTRVCPLNTTP